MSATQVIEAIKELPPEERLDVLRFVREYETVPKLTPEQLGELAERLAHATVPEEVATLEKTMMNGFYGMKSIPKVLRERLPFALLQHLRDRVKQREIGSDQLVLLAR